MISYEFSRVPTQSVGLQALDSGLTINLERDSYKLEADKMANRIMRATQVDMKNAELSRNRYRTKNNSFSIDPANPQRQTIVFQYNLDTMTRRLGVRTTGGQDVGRSKDLKLTGSPKETITFSLEIDAADQLEQGDTNTAIYGNYPALSPLECCFILGATT